MLQLTLPLKYSIMYNNRGIAMSNGPGVMPSGGGGPRRKPRRLIALLLAGTALATAGFLLFHGHGAPTTHNSTSNGSSAPHSQVHNGTSSQQLPDDYTIASSKDARLVSTQPAAPVCPEEVVELKGHYTISGRGFKTHTTTLNAPVANVDTGHFYGFFVPNRLAKTFNADAARGPVNVTVVNINPKQASSCPNPVSGRITSVSPANPSA